MKETNPNKLAERISKKITKSGECLLWTGSKNNSGRGKIKYNGKTLVVTRIVYENLYGIIPENRYVVHSCAFKSCVNPEHLSLNIPAKEDSFLWRFWIKVEKTETCWLWKGSTFENGYGQISYNNKNLRAHRVSFEIHFDEIPVGMNVCHKCDNPLCVNPAHLFLGTTLDNVQDKIKKNRHCIGDKNGTRTKPHTRQRGTENPKSKMTPDKVKEMRRLNKECGFSSRTLAKNFGICRSAAFAILSRRAWKHI